MSPLASFLDHLFTTGEAKLSEPPELDDLRKVQSVLGNAFAEYRLDVGGPLIDFDPDVAAAAAVFTASACWFAVSRQEPSEQLAAQLQPLARPTTASDHLSIDLTLRYAVTVHRRIHAQTPDEVLATRLAETLRGCPLTGILADLTQPPTGDVTLAGHPGLELLYVERLGKNFRPEWLPPAGRIREVFEWVYQHQQKTSPMT